MTHANGEQQEMTARAGPTRDTRLSDRWLTLAHVGWIAVVLLDAAIFIPGVPSYYALLHIPCTSAAQRIGCNPGMLSPGAILALQRVGISLGVYAALGLSMVLVASLVLFAVGAVIAWRRWHEGMGLFVSLVLITLGATGISDVLVNSVPLLLPHVDSLVWSLLHVVGTGIIYMQWPAFAVFLLTFPTGRLDPRWSWVVISSWLAVELAFILGAPQLVIIALITIALGATLAVQVYRYRRVYGVVQRQQTKWLVYSIAAAVSLGAVVTLAQALASALGTPASSSQAAALVVSIAFFLPVALAIGIAILRYRLYDIDIIINRTLVYGSLTALLAAVYFGTVIGAQSVVRALTGQVRQSPVLIVASTLLIAALFNPLRQRLQAFIDRRFYRSKYDAARTLETFGATLRSEVDLNQLSEHLLAVVEETMQPTHVSLWLRQPEPREDEQDQPVWQHPLRMDSMASEAVARTAPATETEEERPAWARGSGA
jgi:hypothetical protein